MKHTPVGILASVLLAAVAIPAQAFTWEWSATGTGLTASGNFSTAGPATSFEAITGISGAYNGHTITGLVPLPPDPGADPGFAYNNQFSSVGMPFDLYGLLFTATDVGNVNFYGIGTNLFAYNYGGNPLGANVGDGINIRFTAVPVPEPETYAMMLVGLGCLGAIARRRRTGAT